MDRLRVLRRFRALVRADPAGVRAGFVAHLLATATGLVAGLILASITGTLEQLPGLLVLVPAAVGLRGNVYGAMGSRLGTLVATGNFRLSRRRDTEVGQNLWASVGLSLSLSLLLAVVAKGVAEAFGVRGAISVADFAVVSVLGGLIPTAVVMVITVGVAALGVRREWDVDNVAAPVVTAAGDMITLPCLFLATFLITDVSSEATTVCAVVAALIGLTALATSLRSHLPVLRRIVRESIPILLAAGTLSTLAGVTIQSRLTSLVDDPALLIVVPPLLSLSGSLAGILSARVSTKLHLGL
ncbi:MAG: magnesium transporter, partial [Acidimicrobiia bacterium]|nr:magnesium transporter [Acidimicrobiia bacterium]